MSKLMSTTARHAYNALCHYHTNPRADPRANDQSPAVSAGSKANGISRVSIPPRRSAAQLLQDDFLNEFGGKIGGLLSSPGNSSLLGSKVQYTGLHRSGIERKYSSKATGKSFLDRLALGLGHTPVRVWSPCRGWIRLYESFPRIAEINVKCVRMKCMFKRLRCFFSSSNRSPSASLASKVCVGVCKQ